ncbi:ABC transporter ATP-binding protein [Candidatus Odyssella acanthamoebae]|uniref:ABC transporter n=1 Tax=Candidatus Odyssella acanthamoebae TaxID=91604 RepID=A0A077AWI2_9PROT|nr:ABC transporter ATP-binding protein [Candidatus Paracaedibacter acanthamoebae]AIK95993.1 ABC transporter [Candidatus Paracaedibacter acanthamoebae]
MTQTTLILDSITRTFEQAEETLEILKNINFQIQSGEIVALVGHSGAGKSTLLQIAGLLEPPTTGRVIMAGKDTVQLSDTERTHLRNRYVGFVYQFHHLLPEFSAVENVMVPQLIANTSAAQARLKAKDLLVKLGLSHRLEHRPKKLSGGEQQRVAIARALANSPKILLADEPTGNLDYATSDIVFGEMMQLVRETGMSALIATHNSDLAKKMDRIIEIKAGQLV